jgi:hypothetical protein
MLMGPRLKTEGDLRRKTLEKWIGQSFCLKESELIMNGNANLIKRKYTFYQLFKLIQGKTVIFCSVKISY